LKHLEVELDIPSFYVSDVEFRFGDQIDHLHDPNCFRIVQRTDFDHALAKAALNRGLDLHEDEMLIDVSRSRNRLIVKTNRGGYSVQALVGADGALSAVRRKMMAPRKAHLAPTIQVFAPIDPQYDAEFNEKKIVLNLTPIMIGLQGYAWHVPCLIDGRPSVAHGVVDFRIFADRPRANMKQIFRRELQSRNIHPRPESWSSHPIHYFFGEDVLSRPNVLLVGDAAGIESAFGGGIHIALSYGEVAAHALIAAFKHNDYSFHDYRNRLQSHFVGMFMRMAARVAEEIYGNRRDPLNLAREFFSKRKDQPNLLLLLLGGP
jgi:flavin-dependent dehydrogenase